MGQIKNIKLHIVTDIKRIKNEMRKLLGIPLICLLIVLVLGGHVNSEEKLKEVKDVKKDEGITEAEEEKADDKDTSEDGVDDNEILDIEVEDDGEEAEQNDPYVHRRYRRYRRRYRRSYYRNYWRRRWGKK